MRVQFTVDGVPQPQGSTRAFIPKGWARPIITSANKNLKPWRQQVSGMAKVAMGEQPVTERPIWIELRFYFTRPKSTKAGVLWKTTKPDIDKLLRGVLDSLTGIVFRDDSQVAVVHCHKEFSDNARVDINLHDELK